MQHYTYASDIYPRPPSKVTVGSGKAVQISGHHSEKYRTTLNCTPQWKRGSCVSSTEVIILLFCGLACLVYKSCHLCVLHQHHLGQYKYLCHCLGRKWVEYLTSQLDFELGSPLCLSCNSQDGRWLEPSHPSLGPQMGVRLSLLSVGRLFGFRS